MFGNDNNIVSFVADVAVCLIPLGIWKLVEIFYWTVSKIGDL